MHKIAPFVAALVACSRPVQPAPTANVPAPSPATAPVAAAPSANEPAHGPPIPSAEMSVEAPARTALLTVGDRAPAFRARAHDGTMVEAGHVEPRAKRLVVYFYPRDETPGCTIEAEHFRDSHAGYDAQSADVVGVSLDTLDSHRDFARGHNLNFPLLSDFGGHLAAAFGVPTTGGYARRITFVIDRTDHVSAVFPDVDPSTHSAEVLGAVQASR